MNTLLASLLIAQAAIPYSEAAKDPQLTFRLGEMMGVYACQVLPYVRSQTRASERAVDNFTRLEDKSVVGFFRYVINLPHESPPAQSYLDGMFHYINARCPQYNSLPIY